MRVPGIMPSLYAKIIGMKPIAIISIDTNLGGRGFAGAGRSTVNQT